MLISYNWLGKYFKDKLPEPEKIAEALTMHAFEIESTEKTEGDYIFDIDVLPNRAPDSLSHRGIAREISVILGLKLKEDGYKNESGAEEDADLEVEVLDEKLCRRYIGKKIGGVEVGESPEEIKKLLEVIEQKSINNIVDITNYVMFSLGQPLHAFDADKIDGGKIIVRKAKDGEKITTLDKTEIALDSDTLVVADSSSPLAVAGIKGGTKAEVDGNTKNIILEAANFNHVNIRKTSRRIGIQTDSSKRFENGITPELAGEAIELASNLIKKYAGGSSISVNKSVDMYPRHANKYKVGVSVDEINNVLGTSLSSSDVEKILNKFSFEYKVASEEEQFVVTIPYERLDLRIKEDLVEEIGRIYGYKNIESKSFDNSGVSNIPINKKFYYANKIRDILIKNGFSEVFTYTFTKDGDIEVANPIAKNKKFLRSRLFENFDESLKLNEYNSDLLELDDVKIFEIGKVFIGKGKNMEEKTMLVIGRKITKWYRNEDRKEIGKNPADGLECIMEVFEEELGVKIKDKPKETSDRGGVLEVDFDSLVDSLPDPAETKHFDISEENKIYTPISQYPFIARDIAVFVPKETDIDEIKSIISKFGGELLVRGPRLIDKFEKKDAETGEVEKVSFAFRMVFQSMERTLTDEETNNVMNSITDKINNKEGWQVR